MQALRAEIGWPTFGPLPPSAVIQRELDAIVLAGRFSWARCHELPGPDRLDGFLEATELFAAAYPLAPGSVPVQAAAVCAAISSGDGVDPAELHNDALDMLDEALARRDLKAVDQAIWQIAAAGLAAHGGHAEPLALTSLGSAWLDRFKITGRSADIDNAITALRRAVAVPALGSEEAGRRANLSSALLKRFELRGGAPELSEAVATGRTAAELARRACANEETNVAHPGEPSGVALALHASLSSLAGALLASFEYRRNRPDLDEAVLVSREAVDWSADDDPARAPRLANLANVLSERFSLFWQVADLEEAFRDARDAVAAVSAEDLARAPCLSALALAYVNRFDYAGELADLDEAIAVGQQAVAAAPGGHPDQAACRSNLGAALQRRYDQVGDCGALDEAVTVHQQAVQATPTGPHRARYLNNLGNALRSRFAAATDSAIPRNPRMADIEKSIAAGEEAVATAGSGETDRPGYVASLALSLVMAAERGGNTKALDQAITILEREARALGADHPLRHVYCVSLGSAWRARFDATGGGDALGNAVTWFSKGADAVPAGHPRHAESLAGLSAVLLRRFERTGDPGDGREALTISKRAASIAAAPALTRALAARNWGETAARLGNAREAMEGFGAAVNLLDTVAWRRLRRGDQERQLGRFVALACDAAAWAITCGDTARAVELLEQGRGVLLAQSLDERARYHDLARTDDGLANSLARIDQALENLHSPADPLAADIETLARRRAELAEERGRLLERIRRLAGLEDFLKPPQFASLQDAASGGPVVIVNVSKYRCDALIVSTSGVTVTNLGTLSAADAVGQAAAFAGALQTLAAMTAEPEKAEAAEQIITAALPWLWDTITSPLMPELHAACHREGDGQRPRVWWCPTGPLTFLPVHAAGRHDVPGESVIDNFTSSYAPTLRLLRQARHQATPGTADRAPLLVALPDTPGQPHLDGVSQEADAFAKRFRRAKAKELRGPEATVEATWKSLKQCPPWVHFACHGIQDISDPSAGHLALHDGSLPIGEISGLRLDGTTLAFLSACETSRGGAELADEAITLATAFRIAGYRHVIGTLWNISDEMAPGVADHVYEAVAQPGGAGIDASSTAAALNTAVLTLRQSRPGEPWFWAPYVHIGP
jgi:tetratricopeptide (TPR) repeat protein